MPHPFPQQTFKNMLTSQTMQAGIYLLDGIQPGWDFFYDKPGIGMQGGGKEPATLTVKIGFEWKNKISLGQVR